MAARVATSPDGRQWEIVVRRVRLPGWPHWDDNPEEGYDGDLVWGAIWAVVSTVLWLVVSLLVVIVQLPVALVRPLVSPVRWVEAECGSPSVITILWKTTRDRAEHVADEIARRLPDGYGDLTPEGAELVSMTEPPGLRDLD